MKEAKIMPFTMMKGTGYIKPRALEKIPKIETAQQELSTLLSEGWEIVTSGSGELYFGFVILAREQYRHHRHTQAVNATGPSHGARIPIMAGLIGSRRGQGRGRIGRR